MKLSELSHRELANALCHDGIGLSIGPFTAWINSRINYMTDSLCRLYGDYELLLGGGFFDFRVAMQRPRGLRSFVHQQSLFLMDGETPFKPLPINQAYPFFEWGFNWCIAQYAHNYLILHAAVVEKDGIAAILPGNPGAGKSTLCASLVANGWRLLSDEMALIPRDENCLIPVPRPVALKNNSIDLLKAFAPHAIFGDSFHDTAKGTVAHMKPSPESVQRSQEPALPGLLIFPRFDSQARATMTPVSKAQSFLKAVEHSFNYDYLGEDGFERMNRLISSCACFSFTYPSLEVGLEEFTRLWESELKDGGHDA